MRSSNGWGVDHRPGRPHAASRARPIFYTARVPAAGDSAPRADDPLRVPVAELRGQRHDQLEELDVQRRRCWPATTRCTARACARTPSTLSGFVARRRATKYKMYEIPFSKMIQPRARRDLGLQRQGHGLRQLRALQPGGELAAARRVVGSQPRRRRIDAHFDAERRAVRAPTRSPRRPASCSSHDLTPRDDQRVPGRHGAAVRPPADRPAYGRYREGSHFWEDTNNNARVAFNPPAGIPRELYIPDLDGKLRADRQRRRQRLDLRDRRARRRLHASTTRSTLESEWRSEQGASCAARTPGATTTATSTRTTRRHRQRREHLHRLVEHRRRRRAASCGTTRTATCAATARTCSSSTATTCCPGTPRPARLVVAQSGQPWEAWSYEPYRRADDQHERHEPLRRAGRLAPHARALQLDLNYTQNFRLGGAAATSQLDGDLFNVFDKQTGYNIEPRVAQLRRSARRGTSSTRGASSSRSGCSSSRSSQLRVAGGFGSRWPFVTAC